MSPEQETQIEDIVDLNVKTQKVPLKQALTLVHKLAFFKAENYKLKLQMKEARELLKQNKIDIPEALQAPVEENEEEPASVVEQEPEQ